MERKNEAIIVIMEEHLHDRYKYMIIKNNLKCYKVENLNNIQLGTSVINIFNRIVNRNIIDKEYIKLYNWIKEEVKCNNFKEIFLSSSEGYIAHNFIKRLKYDFPEINLVALQHGIFSLENCNNIIRKVINKIIYTFFNIYPLGVGFGEKIVDKYIVYNEKYKDFLVENYKWDKNDVVVDLKFLKSELYDNKKKNKNVGGIALFLPQCLYEAGLTTKDDEIYLNKKVIKYLLDKYEKVIIKEHPACSNKNIIFSENIEYTDNLVEAFNKSSAVYSFMSTALVEAEIFDIEIYAIHSKRIGGNKEIYRIFKKVIDFEKTINI